MLPASLLFGAAVLALTLAIPPPTLPRRPLVIWHGLGDSHSSPGMLEFIEEIKQVHPGIFVHSILIEEELEADQRASWLGDVNEQLSRVALQLSSIPELSTGFDAIGFSQGGQFLRAFNELYNDPPVHNLITFGAQHMGVSGLPGCKKGDLFCNIARNAARAGVYTDWAQHHLVQAQYFRDHRNLDQYFVANTFLAPLNNEVAPELQNSTYKENFISLENLVLIMFSNDQTVVPKESAWFGSYSTPTDSSSRKEPEIVSMRVQPVYIHDTFGLKSLDEIGRVHLEVCEGAHMQISRDCWEPLIKKFIGQDLLQRETSLFRVQAY